MATRFFKVLVDQIGHTPPYLKGATLQLNDDDPQRKVIVDGEERVPWVNDLDWLLEQEAIVEIDMHGNLPPESSKKDDQPTGQPTTSTVTRPASARR